MLYAARADEPERYRGAVVRVEASPFAPSAVPLPDHASGAVDGEAFARRYVWGLRQLWHADRQAFLEAIELASGGTAGTIVDGWGDAPHAPRRLLAAALKQIAQIARTRQYEARRKARPARARAARTAAGSAPPPP
jgi:hypothetical protein